jgi:hypothetical protein
VFKTFLESKEYKSIDKVTNKALFCTYRWKGIGEWNGEPSILVAAEEPDNAKELPKAVEFVENEKFFSIPIVVTPCNIYNL